MEQILSKLTIKVFHMDEVVIGDQNIVTSQGKLQVCPVWFVDNEFIDHVDIKIISPDDHSMEVTSVMDVTPISAKVLGKLGEGITHTLTGVYVMMTGADVNGAPCAAFGACQGVLSEVISFDKAGTPASGDYIIHFDITFKDKMAMERRAVTEAHKQCDAFMQIFREQIKLFKGDDCTERHTYVDKYVPGRKNVVMIRQVAGQGAMYDNYILPKEPFGASGGNSIIDLGCMPVMLTPNEYRDGAIRSMQ